MEKKVRALAKTISWRITATIITMSLVWIFTQRIELALSVGGVEAILKMVVYYLHERVWNSISMGRTQ